METVVAQVTVTAQCDLGTTADMALLAVADGARLCTLFFHQVPLQRLHFGDCSAVEEVGWTGLNIPTVVTADAHMTSECLG